MESQNQLLQEFKIVSQENKVLHGMLKVSKGISKKPDFVEPAWPLATSGMVMNLNSALKQSEYRDQVVTIYI